MANIKVSEMTEATSFDDGDYTMIVQANQNKKISKENIFSNLEDEIDTNATDISTINTNIGDLTNLETPIKTSVVDSINSSLPTILFNNANNTSLNVTLSDSSANYSYLEFYFTDTSRTGYTKVSNPNGQNFSVIIVASFNSEIQLKSASYSISGTSITNTKLKAVTLRASTPELWESSIYITKVLGYK